LTKESNVAKEDIEEKDDQEPEMVVIEEGSPEHKALQERDEDEREEQDVDVEAEDERIGKSETTEEERQLYGRRRPNETDEQYRERRRQERKQKKANRQAAISRNRTELRFLESRNEALERQNMDLQRRVAAVERGQTQTQVLTIDGRISQAEAQLEEAKALKTAALDSNNGADVVKCDEIIEHLNTQLRGLRGYKEHLAKGGTVRQETSEEPQERRQPGSPRVQPPTDPKIAKHSQGFQERLDWFDPTGKDPESATVYAIDVALAKDGRWDPRTPKYWQELERRVRAALPHRFEDADEDPEDLDEDLGEPQARQKTKGPRLPGASRATKGSNTFYLSAERKQAMIDAGVYDDPKLRQKYIRKYREWDQQNAGRK
jgi:hypothetical protein